MKTITMIFLSLLLSKSCASDLGDFNNAVVEYNATSRGFFLSINIENQKLFVSKTRGEKPSEIKISKSNWSELATLFKAIHLEEIPTYKAPTEKRLFDGAAHAGFKVKHNDKEYQSEGFDHGNPPVELAAFINKLVSISVSK